MGLHLGNGLIGESLFPADRPQVPLNLRLEPQVRELGGVKSGGLDAAETLLTNLRLFRIRNGPRAVSPEDGQMKGEVWCRRGGRRRRGLGERGEGESREGEGDGEE